MTHVVVLWWWSRPGADVVVVAAPLQLLSHGRHPFVTTAIAVVVTMSSSWMFMFGMALEA
jgi:hypothetical protein